MAEDEKPCKGTEEICWITEALIAQIMHMHASGNHVAAILFYRHEGEETLFELGTMTTLPVIVGSRMKDAIQTILHEYLSGDLGTVN